MKRKKNIIFVIIIFIILVFVIQSMIQSFARYSDIANSNGDIPIASWNFEEDNKNEEITINLLDNIDSTKLIDGKIAPGISGNFQLKVSNKNTDVSIEYNIEFDMNNVPSNLTITNPENGEGTLKYGEEKILTFDWKWEYYTNDSADKEDTEYIGNKLEIPVSITGRQIIDN